jgi:hypothetical protein
MPEPLAKPFPPVFATNNPQRGETVASEINRLLAGLRENYTFPPNLAFATAYMNPQGFALIADEVERAPRVRLLLGADPEEPYRTQQERGHDVSFDEVARVHLSELEHSRDLLGFSGEADAAARRLVAWLRSDEGGNARVEVRRFTKGFLHGKAYIADHPLLPAVLAGSSNLTAAGLSWNRELNLGYPSGQHTGLVLDWFNELWDDSDPFDLAALYEARWQPHAPGIVFLRMLHELYGDGNGQGEQRTDLPVTDFQRDGIRRAARIMDELGGVLVCDEVGLGKTFIAGEFLKQVTVRDRQRALVVVPAALKTSTWEPFLRHYDLISARVEVATYDDVRNGTKRGVRPEDLDDYALVIIDEAHNLRNPATLTAEAVMRLLWGEHPKKVVLLTATPVNNSLRDLQTLISYFVRNDAQFASIGIPSVIDYIKAAQRLDPESLSPEHLFDLMDKVAVRRTRRFIKTAYAHDRIRNNRGELVPIEFPTPSVHRIEYELDDEAAALATAVIRSLAVSDDEELVIRSGVNRESDRLSLGRYASSVYRNDRKIDGLQVVNAGLLRSMLLKRLESSTAALEVTLERLLTSHRAFTAALTKGYVMIGDALREYASSDVEDVSEFFEGLDEATQDQMTPIGDFDAETLRLDVEGDITLLGELLEQARHRRVQGPDDKVAELLRHLERIAEDAERLESDNQATTSDRRKVLIFSTYADTVIAVHDALRRSIDEAPEDSALSSYRGRLAPAIYGAQGSEGQTQRADVLAGFCPKTAGELDDEGEPKNIDHFDVLVTSDVLAEGVNLQQAGHLVNYDLPWNPMKLVQRHGRIDRIGSPHRRVAIGCFFPAKNLDELLKLEATLQRKIAYANAAVGVGEVLPDQVADPTIEIVLHDTEVAIRNLYDEDAELLVSAGGSEALSGEEYRRNLAKAMEMSNVRRAVLSLPYGSGSGHVTARVHQAGYVFCVRIGEESKPWFRFVAADPVTWEPVIDVDAEGKPKARIIADTLSSLIAADPGTFIGEQVMAEAARHGVFAAWELAHRDIYDRWTFLTDQANLQPKVELALRQAYALVQEHGEFLGHDIQDELMAKLNGRWGSTVVKAIRQIVRDEAKSNKMKVENLRDFVNGAGLQVPEQPQPLRAVSSDDVRLVCWMAVAPEASNVPK